MGTAENPDVYIQYYDDSVPTPLWRTITSKAGSFSVRDGGLLKIPVAMVNLVNPDYTPALFDRLKITVDVRGVNDVIFYGDIEDRQKIPMRGTQSDYSLRLAAYGLEKRLKRDTITWDYVSEQESREPETKWTFKTMIEDFLALGDSGYNTNMTLDTDVQEITNKVYGDCDFEKTMMTDAFRRVAETIGYDGYVWLDGSTVKVKFVKLGTLVASPATTLADPFIGDPKLDIDIDEIRNFIYIWGGVDVGYPPDRDKFTENVMTKYTGVNAVWEPLDGETLTDYDLETYEPPEKRESTYSLKAAGKASGGYQLRFRVDRTSLLEADFESRFPSVNCFMKPYVTDSVPDSCKYYIKCTDDINDTIRCGSLKAKTNQWNKVVIPTPMEEAIEDYPPPVWRYTGGSTTFNKDKVKYVDLIVEDYANQSMLLIDWWYFGGGRKIDPFQNPSAYPSPATNGYVKDDTSINNYGLRLYHHTDLDLKSFDQAAKAGNAVLQVLKDPVKTVTCRKLGHTWLRPNQTVTLNSSTLGISSETWRTVELGWDWSSRRKVVYATMTLVEQNAKTPPVFAPEGEVPTTTLVGVAYPYQQPPEVWHEYYQGYPGYP